MMISGSHVLHLIGQEVSPSPMFIWYQLYSKKQVTLRNYKTLTDCPTLLVGKSCCKVNEITWHGQELRPCS